MPRRASESCGMGWLAVQCVQGLLASSVPRGGLGWEKAQQSHSISVGSLKTQIEQR